MDDYVCSVSYWQDAIRADGQERNPEQRYPFRRDVGSVWTPFPPSIERCATTVESEGHDGPLSVAVAQGQVFDYFDEVRQVIEEAKQELFFVDPYLNAEFVSRYLTHVSAGVSVRLLAREKLASLLPAVDQFAKQEQLTIQVRSAPNFHDRYVFVDRNACYQSGASFKDGAKTAPTTLTQITDAFPAVLQTYEDRWGNAKVER